jgi:hypothetical protein
MRARKKSEVPGMEEPLQCKYCKTRHGMFYTARFYTWRRGMIICCKGCHGYVHRNAREWEVLSYRYVPQTSAQRF